MIGLRFEVSFRDGSAPVTVELTQYALGRIARFARVSGLGGFSMDTLESSEDRLLWLQLACWAEATRGQAKPQDFDAWLAGVDDFDSVESDPVDPTQPAT